MKIIKYPKREEWEVVLKRPNLKSENINKIVEDILLDVKKRGDQALIDYAKKFDGVKLTSLDVTEAEINLAEEKISTELKSAILVAKKNIEKFHQSQKNKIQKIETMPGVICWQKSVPIEKVGLYIPGGTAPLFSSVLMLALPANIAGCKEIILCTPPDKAGNVHPAILFAAKVAGVKKIYKTGGAQAIAAMSYGTESISKVYKIFGPGNQYVTKAKQIVSLGDVAIDMPAGPSEVEVLADDSAKASFIAADLLSQAEHGVDSQSILVTISEKLAQEVEKEVEKQLQTLSRSDLAKKSLENSKIIILENMQEAIELTNTYAPEHLIISTENYLEVAEKISNAGSVFLGNMTPESAGDYASGTNHTLPTNGYAKAYSGVNLDSFVKKITFQEISEEGLKNIAPIIEIMAENEELTAHKNAVSLRIASIEKK